MNSSAQAEPNSIVKELHTRFYQNKLMSALCRSSPDKHGQKRKYWLMGGPGRIFFEQVQAELYAQLTCWGKLEKWDEPHVTFEDPNEVWSASDRPVDSTGSASSGWSAPSWKELVSDHRVFGKK